MVWMSASASTSRVSTRRLCAFAWSARRTAVSNDVTPALDRAGGDGRRAGLGDRADRGRRPRPARTGGARAAPGGPRHPATHRAPAPRWPTTPRTGARRRRRRRPAGRAGSAGPGGSRPAGSSRSPAAPGRGPPRARPRESCPRAASCRIDSAAAASRRRWASSHDSNGAAFWRASPSSRSAPRPGRSTASRQWPCTRTSTSTVVPSGRVSRTGSPSRTAPGPSPRRISARLHRSARSGSSASANSSEASWLRAGGRSPSSRNARTAQLLRLR